eukprot:1886434-Pyramimonas_sp.AAC.1
MHSSVHCMMLHVRCPANPMPPGPRMLIPQSELAFVGVCRRFSPHARVPGGAWGCPGARVPVRAPGVLGCPEGAL